ncbi:PEP-CTERM sorting domain-containing protein [Edaphobacter modestus]|uniref:Putative secreted protein with PEP-CTERM sorting signal n=1 Tax=Edaphobacter modestus TaxID=388466 RepID=A0A4V2G4Y3_9BACT|nr:PEP-CTERM sorting domain-containing protein [Edaphobacter modestus]RZU42766.1 putative secreted protein with PEP-CTERM sorting signal [Edaphobacter modestus]
MKKFLSSLVVLAALAVAPALHATPITGQFSVTGTAVTDNGSSLDFTPNTINVGAASTIMGDFTTLLTAGEAGIITSPINYASYVPGSASLVFGSGSTLLTFTLDSVVSDHTGNFGNFTGTGTITAAGFDPTLANLFFSTQATGAVTFSATAVSNPSAVPEPSTLMLLGTGLIGAAGALKRRLS